MTWSLTGSLAFFSLNPQPLLRWVRSGEPRLDHIRERLHGVLQPHRLGGNGRQDESAIGGREHGFISGNAINVQTNKHTHTLTRIRKQ